MPIWSAGIFLNYSLIVSVNTDSLRHTKFEKLPGLLYFSQNLHIIGNLQLLSYLWSRKALRDVVARCLSARMPEHSKQSVAGSEEG